MDFNTRRHAACTVVVSEYVVEVDYVSLPEPEEPCRNPKHRPRLRNRKAKQASAKISHRWDRQKDWEYTREFVRHGGNLNATLSTVISPERVTCQKHSEVLSDRLISEIWSSGYFWFTEIWSLSWLPFAVSYHLLHTLLSFALLKTLLAIMSVAPTVRLWVHQRPAAAPALLTS